MKILNLQLFMFIAAYTDVKKEDEKNRVDCDKNSPPQNGKVCRVDVTPSQFGICTKEQNYGYPKSSPCVFLKLNKVRWIFVKFLKFFLTSFYCFQIYGWYPHFYNKSSELPDLMPKDLQDKILGQDDKEVSFHCSHP